MRHSKDRRASAARQRVMCINRESKVKGKEYSSTNSPQSFPDPARAIGSWEFNSW